MVNDWVKVDDLSEVLLEELKRRQFSMFTSPVCDSGCFQLCYHSIDELQGGRLQLDDELEGIDLRELAAALRDAPDAEFVTVESDDQTVRIAKEGEFLVVRVEERGKHSSEKVRVRMPLAVFDALFGGDENELDLLAALEVLGQYEGEALIDVESDDTSVRVWIDSSENGR